MYSTLLFAHSWLRWVVIILVVLVMTRSLKGWLNEEAWSRSDRRNSLWLMISVDLQVLLGILMLFGASPLTQAAFQNGMGLMKVPTSRFFVVEHPLMMGIALVLLHIAIRQTRRLVVDWHKHRYLFVALLLDLILMGVSTPWPVMPYGRPLIRMW